MSYTMTEEEFLEIYWEIQKSKNYNKVLDKEEPVPFRLLYEKICRVEFFRVYYFRDNGEYFLAGTYLSKEKAEAKKAEIETDPRCKALIYKGVVENKYEDIKKEIQTEERRVPYQFVNVHVCAVNKRGGAVTGIIRVHDVLGQRLKPALDAAGADLNFVYFLSDKVMHGGDVVRSLDELDEALRKIIKEEHRRGIF